jgi:hypothetical protein
VTGQFEEQIKSTQMMLSKSIPALKENEEYAKKLNNCRKIEKQLRKTTTFPSILITDTKTDLDPSSNLLKWIQQIEINQKSIQDNLSQPQLYFDYFLLQSAFIYAEKFAVSDPTFSASKRFLEDFKASGVSLEAIKNKTNPPPDVYHLINPWTSIPQTQTTTQSQPQAQTQTQTFSISSGGGGGGGSRRSSSTRGSSQRRVSSVLKGGGNRNRNIDRRSTRGSNRTRSSSSRNNRSRSGGRRNVKRPQNRNRSRR